MCVWKRFFLRGRILLYMADNAYRACTPIDADLPVFELTNKCPHRCFINIPDVWCQAVNNCVIDTMILSYRYHLARIWELSMLSWSILDKTESSQSAAIGCRGCATSVQNAYSTCFTKSGSN